MPPPQQAPPPPPMMTPAPEPISPPRKGNALASLALALGAAGLALALVGMVMFPGPAGAAGPQGLKGEIGNVGPAGSNGTACWDLNGNGIPDLATEDKNLDGAATVLDCKGPAGAGTVMASYTKAVTTAINSSCDPLMNVTITVPSSGQLVVQSWFYSALEHTAPGTDSFWFKLSPALNDCSIDAHLGVFIVMNMPTDTYYKTDSSLRIDAVTAGTYNYNLNGMMMVGQSSGDLVFRGSVLAVFYPS